MLKVRKMINGEFFAQMKSKDADAENLEAVLTGNLEQLRAKFPKIANSFVKFHVTLTPEKTGRNCGQNDKTPQTLRKR